MYTMDWWNEFSAKWNDTKPQCASFIHVGRFLVSIDDEGPLTVSLTWSKDGRLSVGPCANVAADPAPRFTGNSAVWKSFIDGSQSGPSLVVRGLIRYSGPSDILLEMVPHFQRLADVARKVRQSERDIARDDLEWQRNST